MFASHWSFLLGYILKIFFICRFCVGDHFYLYENKILCGPDYEERMVFANLSANPAQLAILKSQQQQQQSLGSRSTPLPPSAYPSPAQGFHHQHQHHPHQPHQQHPNMPLPPNGLSSTAMKGDAVYHPQHYPYGGHHGGAVPIGPPHLPDASTSKDLTPLPPISSVRSSGRALQT